MSEDAFMIAVLLSVAVVTVLMIVVALPVVLSMRQAAKDREFQHAERIKALEMGRPLPGETATHGPVSAAGVGIWVPISVFGIALAASVSSDHSLAAEVALWLSAGFVGVTALICGTVLTLRAPAWDARAADHVNSCKPSFEESEIDTVSRRGY